jgi:hypothetical protein
MQISPEYSDEKALELLLKKLGLPEEDYWEQLGTEWLMPKGENTFIRIRKGEFDVAIVFGNDDRIDICPIVGYWDGPASLEYEPGKSVANMPFGAEWVSELEEALETAAIKRRSTFKVCKYCKEYLAPEHMLDGKTCQGCASLHDGVVY